MKVLVTGANGFVGRGLIDALKKSNRVEPVALVRNPVAEVAEGVEKRVGGQLEDLDGRDKALDGIDATVHLAARAHVLSETEADPLVAFRRVNVGGTLRMARQAAEAGVQRFVFISSIGVNGNETMRAFSEDDAPSPREPYAISKREAEDGLQELAAETGMELVIIRPPLVYGSGAPGNFGALARWVRRGVPLPLGAVTENRRSLVALDNLVDLIVTCLDHPRAAGETFLVSDGEDVSTAELLRRVGVAMDKPARLIPVPVPLLRACASLLGKRAMADRLLGSLQVDSSKVRDVLGWRPPVSLDEGLRRAVGRGR